MAAVQGSIPITYIPCNDELRKSINKGETLLDEENDFYQLWENYSIDLTGDYEEDANESGVEEYITSVDDKTVLRINDEAMMLKVTYYMKMTGTITTKECTHLRCTWKKYYCPEKVRPASNQHQLKATAKTTVLDKYETLKAKQEHERELHKKKQRNLLDKLYKKRTTVQKSIEANTAMIKGHQDRLEKNMTDLNIIERNIAELENDIRWTSPPKKRELPPEEHQVGGGVDQGELEDYEDSPPKKQKTDKLPQEFQVGGGIDQGETD